MNNQNLKTDFSGIKREMLTMNRNWESFGSVFGLSSFWELVGITAEPSGRHSYWELRNISSELSKGDKTRCVGLSRNNKNDGILILKVVWESNHSTPLFPRSYIYITAKCEGKIQSLKKGKSDGLCCVRKLIIWEHKEEMDPGKEKKK